MGEAIRKVRGGKLLRVRLEHDARVITALTLTGDFFLYPEDGLDQLEQGLIGTPLSDEREEMVARIEVLLSIGPITVLGFGAQDLVEAIMEAKR